MQTEMHHVRTLLIMMEVYSKGLVKELQLEPQTLDRLFPALGELLDLHTSFLTCLLERKRESQQEGEDGGFIINKIGDILETQVRGGREPPLQNTPPHYRTEHHKTENHKTEHPPPPHTPQKQLRSTWCLSTPHHRDS